MILVGGLGWASKEIRIDNTADRAISWGGDIEKALRSCPVLVTF